MNCLVTAGPTYEPLDEVRRLTNFSTGRLGAELARALTEHGHEVTLLNGYYSVHPGPRRARHVETFTTTADLGTRLESRAGREIEAVFHAAAVSDFKFGAVYEQDAGGRLTACAARKVSTRNGRLLAELLPTPKLLSRLRDWFPAARLAGWKYEMDGDRARLLDIARSQMRENRTDACVINGAAYGAGFGLVRPEGEPVHLSDVAALCQALVRWLEA